MLRKSNLICRKRMRSRSTKRKHNTYRSNACASFVKILKNIAQVVHKGAFGCYEDLECYKTCTSEKNLKKHIGIMHTRGKEKIKEPDFKCNQCGEEFNQLTRSQLSLRTRLSLKGLFERHLWTHKVADFQCNCDNVPVLRPGKPTFQWRLKCTSDNFLGEELGLKGQRLSKIFLEKERHMQVIKVFLFLQYIHVDILKG